jgi:hypothetical protein
MSEKPFDTSPEHRDGLEEQYGLPKEADIREDGWDYVTQDRLLDTIFYQPWKLHPEDWNNLPFKERHSILSSLFQDAEGDDEYALSSINILFEVERNYLLKVLITSFLGRPLKEYTIEEKRDMVAKSWKDISTVQDGQTVIILEVTHLDLNRMVDTPQDLSVQEVEWIVNEIISNDQLLFSQYLMGRIEQREKYSMSENILITQQFSPHSNIWEMQQSIDESFLAPMSKEFAAVYRDDTVNILFPTESLPRTDSGVNKKAVSDLLHLIEGIRQCVEWSGEEGEDISHQKDEMLLKLNDTRESLPASFDEIIQKVHTTIENLEEIGTYNHSSDAYDGYGTEAFMDEMHHAISHVLVEETSRNDTKVFTIEELFMVLGPKDDVDVVDIYKSFSSLHTRDTIENFLGFSYSQIPMRSQLQFIYYLHDKDTDQVEHIREFVSLHGPDGLATFLSLERGDKTLGEKIVEFGTHEGIARTVFRYYGELLDSAERAEQIVREVSGCEGDACYELTQQVRENILNRAQVDLEAAVRTDDPSQVAAQVGRYVAKAKEYVAILQEVGTKEIEVLSTDAVTADERSQMTQLLQSNYDTMYPGPDNEEFRTGVLSSLQNSFSGPETTFRVLRDGDTIVSFNRFDTLKYPNGKEISYFGSFNADPAYNGAGRVMLETTIRERLGDGRPMMAYCDPAQDISRKYVEDGFVVTGFHEFAGKQLFEIWRTGDIAAHVKTKRLSTEALLAMVGASGPIVVREQTTADDFPELYTGMALTRHFRNNEKTYLVFETLPSHLQTAFSTSQTEQEATAKVA